MVPDTRASDGGHILGELLLQDAIDVEPREPGDPVVTVFAELVSRIDSLGGRHRGAVVGVVQARDTAMIACA